MGDGKMWDIGGNRNAPNGGQMRITAGEPQRGVTGGDGTQISIRPNRAIRNSVGQRPTLSLQQLIKP
jgi:hypothetical protein